MAGALFNPFDCLITELSEISHKMAVVLSQLVQLNCENGCNNIRRDKLGYVTYSIALTLSWKDYLFNDN